MRVRYRETGKTDDVEFRRNEVPILVGFGNPCFLEDLLDKTYFITPDTFGDWVLIEATSEERRRLRDAGFPV